MPTAALPPGEPLITRFHQNNADVWYYEPNVRRLEKVPDTPPPCTFGISAMFMDYAATITPYGPFCMRNWGIRGDLPVWYEIWNEWLRGNPVILTEFANLISRDIAKVIGKERKIFSIRGGLSAAQVQRRKNPVYYDTGMIAVIPSNFAVGMPIYNRPYSLETYQEYVATFPQNIGRFNVWTEMHTEQELPEWHSEPPNAKNLFSITPEKFLLAIQWISRLDLIYSYYPKAGYDMAQKFRAMWPGMLEKWNRGGGSMLNDAERDAWRAAGGGSEMESAPQLVLTQPFDPDQIAMQVFVEHLQANGSGYTEGTNIPGVYYTILDRLVNQPAFLAIRRGRRVEVAATPAIQAAIVKGAEAAELRSAGARKIKCQDGFEMMFIKPLLFAMIGAWLEMLPSLLEAFESAVDFGVADIAEAGDWLTGDVAFDSAGEFFEVPFFEEIPTDAIASWADGTELDLFQLDEIFAQSEGVSSFDLASLDPLEGFDAEFVIDEIAVDPGSMYVDPITGDTLLDLDLQFDVPEIEVDMMPSEINVETDFWQPSEVVETPVEIIEPEVYDVPPVDTAEVTPDVFEVVETPPEVIEPVDAYELPPDAVETPPEMIEPTDIYDTGMDAPPEIYDAAEYEVSQVAEYAAEAGDVLTEAGLTDGLSLNFPSLSNQQLFKLAQQAYKLYQQLSAQAPTAPAGATPATTQTSATTVPLTTTVAPTGPVSPSPIVYSTYTPALPVPGAVSPPIQTLTPAPAPSVVDTLAAAEAVPGLSPLWLLLTAIASMQGKL